MKHRIKHIIEYAAIRTVGGTLNHLPLGISLAIGWVLARLSYIFFFRRARIAKARVRQVFGNQFSSKEVNRIAWLSFRNIAFNGIELLRMNSLTLDDIDRLIDHSALDTYYSRVPKGQGAILVVPHMGNWDMSGVAAHKIGLPVFVIAARQRNALVEAYTNRMRGSAGLVTLYREDPSLLRQTLRHLKDGKVLAILTDVRSRTPGLSIRFLGVQANLPGGMAMFSRQTNVPIMPAVLLREGWTRHRWILHEAIRPDPDIDKQEDAIRMTQYVMDIFDAAVRKWPEQYFWYNKRWVLDPLESAGDARAEDQVLQPEGNQPADPGAGIG